MLPSVQTLVQAALLLLAGGYVILGVMTLVPRFSDFAREAWPILLVETLIVGTVALAFWTGGLILGAALLALVFRCMWEAAEVARIRHEAATLSPMLVAGGAVLAALAASVVPVGALSLLVLVACAGIYFRLGYKTFRLEANERMLLDIGLFPGLPLILFAAAGLQGGFGAWLFVAYIFVETFDSYALVGGKLFGRTRAFPMLSPRKTVEGLVFGAVALALTAALGGLVFDLPLTGCMVVALLAGALTVAGDLAASALKRRSKVKDFPTVLPHQGGLLDIADAWIVTGAGLAAMAALTGLA